MKALKAFFLTLFFHMKHFFNSLDADVKKAADFTYKVIENIKNFDQSHSGIVDFITAVIPTDLDSKLVQLFRDNVNKIIFDLGLFAGQTDQTKILSDFTDMLNKMEDGDQKNNLIHGFAVLLTKCLADGKLTYGESVSLIQWYYTNRNSHENLPSTPNAA